MNQDTKPYVYTIKDIAEIIIEQTQNKDYYDYKVNQLRHPINKLFDNQKFERKQITYTYHYTEDFKDYCINNIDLTKIHRNKKESLLEYLYKNDILTYEQTAFIPQSIIIHFLNKITEHKYKGIMTSAKIQGILRKNKIILHPIKVLIDPFMDFTISPLFYRSIFI